MKSNLVALSTALLLVAGPALADKPWEEARGNADKAVGLVALDLDDTLEGLNTSGVQLNFAEVAASITADATVTGTDAASAAVTAAAIGNTLTSGLALDSLQGNFASVTGDVAGSVTDASVTAAALGNSASLTVVSFPNTIGQVNTGAITARVSGTLTNAQDTTAAAIGNSLSIATGLVD